MLFSFPFSFLFLFPPCAPCEVFYSYVSAHDVKHTMILYKTELYLF